MRIGIDARRLLQDNDPTWPYYLFSLISALQDIDKKNEYVLLFNFFRNKYADMLKRYTFHDNVRVKAARIPHRVFEYVFEDLHVPVDLYLGKTDVCHSPVYTCFNNAGGKSIATIHDLIFLRSPEGVSPGWVEFAKKNTDYAVRKADVIVTISEFTKSELVDVYKVAEDRVRVIYNGVGNSYSPKTGGVDDIKVKYGISGKYILFVGAIEPRKNLLALAQAFSHLGEQLREEHTLVVVGADRFGSEEIYRKINELQLGNDILFTGSVSHNELPFLYSGAELFVFPSFSEGFGLPPLEAMACGTPVVASNCTSIPEVVGDAAVLIDPHNTEEITEALKSVLIDKRKRERMKEAGLERAHRFSWERTAKETLALYQEVC